MPICREVDFNVNRVILKTTTYSIVIVQLAGIFINTATPSIQLRIIEAIQFE